GLLRGQAVLSAANEGIPERYWNRMGASEVLGRLQLPDYNRIEKDTQDIETLFRSAGITLNRTQPGRLQEVWTLSCAILAVLFLEPGDCMIYASALLAGADIILTTDTAFRDIINTVQNARSLPDLAKRAYFTHVQNHVLTHLTGIIGPVPSGTSFSVQLP